MVKINININIPNDTSASKSVDHVVADSSVQAGVVGALVDLHFALGPRES